jgi:isopentenyl-diphosphate Delta-isomerase
MNSLTRKLGHIEHALSQSTEVNSFDQIRLRHCALPNIDLDRIKLRTTLFDHAVSAPFFVSSMTGGPTEAEVINRRLAEACREVGIAMGVGSQRVGIEDGHTRGLNGSIRDAIGSYPLFANFGAVNLLSLSHVSELGRILDPIEADALILHLNPMQEVFQASGDTNWTGVIDAIATTCDWSPVPVIAKEVGFGLDAVSVRTLIDAGVNILDVAGRCGTRFADIEIAMNADIQRMLSDQQLFDGWGYTTVECLQMMQSAFPEQRFWASGGIRHGLDVAKALCLGAGAVGIAGRFLKPATESTEAVIATMQQFINELRFACFGMGVESIHDLEKRLLWDGSNAS